MTKLLRLLPAVVFLLTAAACETASPTAEATPAAVDVQPPDSDCTRANLGITACLAEKPGVLFVCGAGEDMASGIPPSWVATACDSPNACIGATSSQPALCGVCSPGTSSCDNGNRFVCGDDGAKWLPAGLCRTTACQCGGKWPHCNVCN